MVSQRRISDSSVSYSSPAIGSSSSSWMATPPDARFDLRHIGLCHLGDDAGRRLGVLEHGVRLRDLSGAGIDACKHARAAACPDHTVKKSRQHRIAVRHVGAALCECAQHAAESEQRHVDLCMREHCVEHFGACQVDEVDRRRQRRGARSALERQGEEGVRPRRVRVVIIGAGDAARERRVDQL
eukprot:7389803-Prymnesium_polylepis.1